MSNEQRAMSNEQRAMSKEQRAVGNGEWGIGIHYLEAIGKKIDGFLGEIEKIGELG
jgi:hypothetical protein